MKQRFYIDTLIWRDYYEGRSDRFRPLGEWALMFFRKALQEQHTILFSSIVVDELQKDYDKEKIQEIFSVIDNTSLFRKASVHKKQFKEASQLSKDRKVPFGDALHAIIARDNEAIVITRDRHFEVLQDITQAKKPEELLY
ncbi:MAG: PIN domain-containing protein [Candidatus Woesearchaeota archaeon]|nr:PIN domain-containing protein [Candidatus Woesearchaeota archaeon]